MEKNLIIQQKMYETILGDWIEKVKSSKLSSKDKEKNILEICYLASFIMSLYINGLIENIDEVSIIEGIRESPDFIILYKGELVGLEIKRVKNDKIEIIGKLNGLLSKSEKLFHTKYPNIKVLSNISFIDNFSYINSEVENIKNQICDYIYMVYNNIECLKPDFIESEFIVEHSSVSFNLSGAYIISESFDSNSIIKYIKENEHYIAKYKHNTNNLKTFLLLVVSMASPDSNFVEVELPSQKVETEFDSVFLLKDFHKEVYLIK